MNKRKIAIIGASYLQRPLVQKAVDLGLETHVFAWREGNVVEDIADHYYPISIIEKEEILAVCKTVEINGITSISSDIAMPTVNFVAHEMGLIGNSLQAGLVTTDKFEMRQALSAAGLPCPRFELYKTPDFEDHKQFTFPVIVKPTDRSGSKGVTKTERPEDINKNLEIALGHSLKKNAIVEEFVEGREFSVEMISFKGEHFPLAITDKVTTGAPFFVEQEHHQPAAVPAAIGKKINELVINALNVLGIEYGASHSEVFLTTANEVMICEIAGRMGGDLIGSDMVQLSTGYDFVKGVIDVAMGDFKTIDTTTLNDNYSGVYYVFPPAGKIKSIQNNQENFEGVVQAISILNIGDEIAEVINVSGKRAGLVLYKHEQNKVVLNPNDVIQYELE